MKAAAAHRFHNDSEVQALFNSLRADLLEEFANTPLQNTDQMIRLRMQLQSLDALRSRLANLAVDHENRDE